MHLSPGTKVPGLLLTLFEIDTMNRFACFAVLLVFASFESTACAAAPLSIDKYWTGFMLFWSGTFGSISGIVGVALATGAIGVFIITRGKWMK